MSATSAPTLAQGAPRRGPRAWDAANRAGAPVAKLGELSGPSFLATDSGHRPGVARIEASRVRMVTNDLRRTS